MDCGGRLSGATSLSLAASGGIENVINNGITWMDAFLGTIHGSMGETSTLAIASAAGVLLLTQIAAWRIVVGVMLGMVGPEPVQRHRLDHQSDVCHALVLAPGGGRLCLRHVLHGHRPGVGLDDQYRQVAFRCPDRGDGGAGPCGQPGVSRKA